MQLMFILFVVVLSTIAYFINEDNFFKGKEKGIKKITTKGWITLGIYFLIILFTFFQHISGRKELKESEQRALVIQNKRDSILKLEYDSSLHLMKIKYDSANLVTITSISELLARNGYILDSNNTKILKVLRDSIKTNIILPTAPILQLCAGHGIRFVKTKNDSMYYDVSFCSYDASCTIDSISISIVYFDNFDNFKLDKKTIKLPKNLKIVVESPITMEMTLPLTAKNKFKLVYMLFRGKYTDTTKEKIFEINDLYFLNILNNDWGITAGEKKDKVLSFVDQRSDQK